MPDERNTKLLVSLLSWLGADKIIKIFTENYLTIGVSSLVGVGIGIGTAGRFLPSARNPVQETLLPDSASLIRINMNQVCQEQKYYSLGTNYKNITPGEATQLSDDKDKTWPVYRWRCQYKESGDRNTKLASLNLNLFCQDISGSKKFFSAYLHYNDSKSWYCVDDSTLP